MEFKQERAECFRKVRLLALILIQHKAHQEQKHISSISSCSQILKHTHGKRCYKRTSRTSKIRFWAVQWYNCRHWKGWVCASGNFPLGGGRIGWQPQGLVGGFRAEYKCRYVATLQAYWEWWELSFPLKGHCMSSLKCNWSKIWEVCSFSSEWSRNLV